MDDKQEALRRDIIDLLKRHNIRVESTELVALAARDPDFRFSPKQIQALCFAGSAFRISNMAARARAAQNNRPGSGTAAVQRSIIDYLERNNFPVTLENYLAVTGYSEESLTPSRSSSTPSSSECSSPAAQRIKRGREHG